MVLSMSARNEKWKMKEQNEASVPECSIKNFDIYRQVPGAQWGEDLCGHSNRVVMFCDPTE